MSKPRQRIIVTGASRGIGAAIAEQLLMQGCDVVGLSRTGTAPPQHGERVSAAQLTMLRCDLADEDAIVKAFAQIGDQGDVHGLVNNAGLHLSSPSASLMTDEFEAVMQINSTAVMIACREVFPLLTGRSHSHAPAGGLIVNIGSFFDKLGVKNNLAYSASKAAVGAMTRCLAVEWAASGVRVVNVAPGYIATDLNKEFLARDSVRDWLKSRIPTGAAGSAHDVASLVGSLFTTDLPFLTGETIYLDGGQGMNH